MSNDENLIDFGGFKVFINFYEKTKRMDGWMDGWITNTSHRIASITESVAKKMTVSEKRGREAEKRTFSAAFCNPPRTKLMLRIETYIESTMTTGKILPPQSVWMDVRISSQENDCIGKEKREGGRKKILVLR